MTNKTLQFDILLFSGNLSKILSEKEEIFKLGLKNTWATMCQVAYQLVHVSIQSPSHKILKSILGISLCILFQPPPVFF